MNFVYGGGGIVVAGMLQNCILSSWADSAGVFTPSLAIQDPSLPDCQGTRYGVFCLREAAEKWRRRTEGTMSRAGGRRPAASVDLSHRV